MKTISKDGLKMLANVAVVLAVVWLAVVVAVVWLAAVQAIPSQKLL